MSPTITTHPQAATKVTADHLRRGAYLYVRQSTLRQVLHNTTSTQRQYDLRGRAIALGWTAEQLIVIDTDQGQSGASAVDRDGFQHLVAEVSMGRAGIVLGLEVSRLARNNADWHRLLEICALSGTLILDEDGLYDPCSFNDRLLLGLKGTMSEAELHLLKARLRGGVLSKARRGELIQRLPVGLVYHPSGRVVLDPDVGVQQAVRHLLATFAATGSAFAVVKAFTTQQLSFPRRLAAGPNKGELVWGPLQHSRVLQVLHNPRYAGAFFYGRHTHRIGPGGKPTIHLLPREQWTVLITDAHPGYLSFAEFEANQARLAELAAARGTDRRASPPREGPALLQGLIVCGRCGTRMTVRYHTRAEGQVPEYVCQAEGIRHGTPICQRIPGVTVDAAVARLLVDTLTPLAIQAALTVAEELVARADQADRIRAAAVQRARYQADLARRRYLAVDPQNRLVADSLEADWNTALRELADATDAYQHATQATTGHPPAGTQTPHPTADQRRHPNQDRPDHRPRPPARRPRPQPASADPAGGLAAPPDPTRRGGRHRRAARRPHRRPDRHHPVQPRPHQRHRPAPARPAHRPDPHPLPAPKPPPAAPRHRPAQPRRNRPPPGHPPQHRQEVAQRRPADRPPGQRQGRVPLPAPRTRPGPPPHRATAPPAEPDHHNQNDSRINHRRRSVKSTGSLSAPGSGVVMILVPSANERVVERAGELAVPVTNEEPRRGHALRPLHRQFPCPLDHPWPVRAARDTGEPNLPRVQFDDEQDVERLEAHGLDGEEVGGYDA